MHCRAHRDIARFQLFGRLLLIRAVAPWAGLARHITRIALLFRRQGRQACEALCGIRHMERRVDTDALVKDKAIALVMRAAAILEIFENTAIKLQHIAEALGLHIGASLLAADAARAEHDDGLVFQFFR